MHAHDRTMLARLGFADPDRREPLHDQACRYLTTTPAISRIIDVLELEYTNRPSRFEYSPGRQHRCRTDRTVSWTDATFEREISKGYGQYRTTIGFIDVHLQFRLDYRRYQVEQRRTVHNRDEEPWTPHEDYADVDSTEAAIEVKATSTPVGEVIRQINLYRSYSRISTWILATTYPLTQSQVDCLSNERIKHVVLGANFLEYVEQQASADPALSVEV